MLSSQDTKSNFGFKNSWQLMFTYDMLKHTYSAFSIIGVLFSILISSSYLLLLMGGSLSDWKLASELEHFSKEGALNKLVPFHISCFVWYCVKHTLCANKTQSSSVLQWIDSNFGCLRLTFWRFCCSYNFISKIGLCSKDILRKYFPIAIERFLLKN